MNYAYLKVLSFCIDMDIYIGDFNGIKHKDTALWETLVNECTREILNISGFTSEIISWVEICTYEPYMWRTARNTYYIRIMKV